MAVFAGYASAWLYKVLKDDDWIITTLLTAFLYPCTVFVIVFVLVLLRFLLLGPEAEENLTTQSKVLWFGISVPLVCVGSYFGFRQAAIQLPVRTNPVPRQIPDQAWFTLPVFTALVDGRFFMYSCLQSW